ncbi:MAG: DNA polymerase III [Treponema sp.]|jgi:DNA polymerase-3 subunit gamma/tau|nr:DNA polymerase III [Treponema sp.]
MFENVLGQEAANQLSEDIRNNTMAPSMLFTGNAASGKGTAALELGRILSCENDASWNCPCPSCAKHRYLYHPDLLALGSRPFSPEIAAATGVFSRNPEDKAGRTLFIRSVRKLLLRFSPILWEDDQKAGKLSPLANSLESDLDELISGGEGEGGAWAEKLSASIKKTAFRLEAEGIPGFIPVAQIRRASYWSRLAPQGKRKLLLIENADRMQDSGRNALLKILEEPPERVVIVLTSAQGRALLPTILSRLRPYRFNRRDEAMERDVLRRVFRCDKPENQSAGTVTGKGGTNVITAYLESFLPVSAEKLYSLSAYFASSLALEGAAFLSEKTRGTAPALLGALGNYAGPVARAAGFPAPVPDTGDCIKTVLAGAENFEMPGLFSQFLKGLLQVVSESSREALAASPLPELSIEKAREADASSVRASEPALSVPGFSDIFRELVRNAVTAAGTYNQNPALVLDNFIAAFKRRILSLYGDYSPAIRSIL